MTNGWYQIDPDEGGLDDLFVPRDPDTGDPLPNTEAWWEQGWADVRAELAPRQRRRGRCRWRRRRAAP
jgi:hypothetical protein